MQDEMTQAERQLMIEGYLAFARENLEWAKGALSLFLEVLPEWEEGNELVLGEGKLSL